MKRNRTAILFFLYLAAGCAADSDADFYVYSRNYNFTEQDHGWKGDFADYPVEDSVTNELNVAHVQLPTQDLNGNKEGLMLSGVNTESRLFMFIKKRITGLNKGREYNISFDVEYVANTAGGSDASTGKMYMKIGASRLEPKKMIEGDFYRLNIDKGNTAKDGEDMKILGEIENPSPYAKPYVEEFKSSVEPFTVSTNSEGEVWLIVGVDSEFQGLTTIYFSSINVVFSTVE